MSNHPSTLDTIKIDKIIIKSTRTAGEVDIDQHKQPEGNRLKLLPDGHMEFKDTKNGRVYSISKRADPKSPNNTELLSKLIAKPLHLNKFRLTTSLLFELVENYSEETSRLRFASLEEYYVRKV